MAGGRTILGSLRGDDVTIPFWLRVAGVVVGAAVAVLVVVSAFTAGPRAGLRARSTPGLRRAKLPQRAKLP